MAETLQIWLPIVSGFIGILITFLSFIIPFLKNSKAKKIIENAVKIAESVQPYIVEAEKFVNYTGEEKKAFVMTKANQYAIENNLKFNTNEVSKQIETLVSLTKNVNAREKDKHGELNINVKEITN